MTERSLAGSRPLVSVVAISFNQVETVTESLNSVFNQTYDTLELIVCDDASTDGTQVLVTEWLAANKSRFHRVRFIQNESNLGICRNFANGFASAKGKWLKPLACDDLLEPDAISVFIRESAESKVQLFFSQMYMFQDLKGEKVLKGEFLTNHRSLRLFNEPKKILVELRKQNFLPAPGAFFSNEALRMSGGIDQRFRNLDDWPLWINMLLSGAEVRWIPTPLVNYRLSSASVSQSSKKQPISSAMVSDLSQFFDLYQRGHLRGLDLWESRLTVFRMNLVFRYLGNNWYAFNLLKCLQLLSPITWSKIIGRIFRSRS